MTPHPKIWGLCPTQPPGLIPMAIARNYWKETNRHRWVGETLHKVTYRPETHYAIHNKEYTYLLTYLHYGTLHCNSESE